MSDHDTILEEVVDPRLAVLIVWAVFFFVFIVLPSLCLRCLGCCAPGRNNEGRAYDAAEGGMAVEDELGYPGGAGGWDRYGLLSAGKRREVDERRASALRRYLGRCSVVLDEVEHMVRLTEGGSVKDKEEDGAAVVIVSGDSDSPKKDEEGSSPSPADDAPAGSERRDDDPPQCRDPPEFGDPPECVIRARGDRADPDDYIRSDDEGDEEAARPSQLMSSPDDFTPSDEEDEGYATPATTGMDPPTEEGAGTPNASNAPTARGAPPDPPTEEDAGARTDFQDAPESQTEVEGIVTRVEGIVTRVEDIVPSEAKFDCCESWENEYIPSTSEYTHVHIPLPGHYRDGTKIEERKPGDSGDYERISNSSNWRLPFFQAKVKVADEATKDGEKDLEAGATNEDECTKNTKRKERRNVPAFCAICLGEYAPAETISWSSNPACTHVFHRECIVQWLTTLGRRSARYQRFGSFDDDPLGRGALRLLDYGLECPCCRQDFIWKDGVVPLSEDEEGGDNRAEGKARDDGVMSAVENV